MGGGSICGGISNERGSGKAFAVCRLRHGRMISKRAQWMEKPLEKNPSPWHFWYVSHRRWSTEPSIAEWAEKFSCWLFLIAF